MATYNTESIQWVRSSSAKSIDLSQMSDLSRAGFKPDRALFGKNVALPSHKIF